MLSGLLLSLPWDTGGGRGRKREVKGGEEREERKGGEEEEEEKREVDRRKRKSQANLLQCSARVLH